MKHFIILVSLFLTLSITSAPVYADPAVTNAPSSAGCQPIYGGGETCVRGQNLVINKTVQHPTTQQFVDNLNINDPKFAPEQIVTFRITITNTGNTKLSNITLKDIFPQFINFVSGDGGSFDANSKTLQITGVELGPGESKTFTVVGKVVPANQIPDNQIVACVINQAIATVDNQSGQDNSNLCLSKQVAPAAQAGFETKGGLKVFPPAQAQAAPPTGPELIPLLALIPSGALGMFLRRKTK